jgi:hypothetical protein
MRHEAALAIVGLPYDEYLTWRTDWRRINSKKLSHPSCVITGISSPYQFLLRLSGGFMLLSFVISGTPNRSFRSVNSGPFLWTVNKVGRPMRHLWAIVVLAATSGVLAETPDDKALKACLLDALPNYAKAKLAFDASRGSTPMQQTIDYYMARRRLEEGYCVQYRIALSPTRTFRKISSIWSLA